MAVLTRAQKDVLRDIASMHVPAFYPTDLYPARNNVDNGKRRTLSALQRLGLLTQRPDDYRLVLTGYGRQHLEGVGQ